MNDSVSILVAVFLILITLRWMLGGNQNNQHQQGQRGTTTGARRTPHRVTPQMIEMVRSMFPDIPTAAIQADLQRTGSVETTVDNALRDGGLPLPPPITSQQQGSPNSNATNSQNASSSSRKSPSHPNLIQRYKIDVEQNVDQEPPKVWEASPDKRQEILRKRREFMVLQARQKLLEQQTKKQQNVQQEQAQGSGSSTSATPPLSVSTDEDDKTIDAMSVEELNTLSPEQRRDQMLQALQRRTSTS